MPKRLKRRSRLSIKCFWQITTTFKRLQIISVMRHHRRHRRRAHRCAGASTWLLVTSDLSRDSGILLEMIARAARFSSNWPFGFLFSRVFTVMRRASSCVWVRACNVAKQRCARRFFNKTRSLEHIVQRKATSI